MKKFFIFVLEISRFLYLSKPQISKSVTTSSTLLHNGSYTYAYFFWILNAIEMKFGQILVCCMANIFNMFLAQCWRLETVPYPFMILLKLAISRDLAIVNNWHLSFLNALFKKKKKKNETLESWHNWLLDDWNKLLNWKGPET